MSSAAGAAGTDQEVCLCSTDNENAFMPAAEVRNRIVRS